MKKFLDNLKSSGKLKVEETDIHFWINDQEITSKFLAYKQHLCSENDLKNVNFSQKWRDSLYLNPCKVFENKFGTDRDQNLL